MSPNGALSHGALANGALSNGELWNWSSPVWLVAAGVLVAYAVTLRQSQRRWGVLTAALVLFVLAYVSPLGVLADGYLFSAHMAQHLLVLLVVPLLLLLSLPREKVERWFASATTDRLGCWLANPVTSWLGGVGAMWFWHVPTFCTAATLNPWLGAVRDLSFLVAGTAFWWPIFAPAARYRLPPLTGILYLFSACLGCTLLGIYITFTTISVCPAFANPADRLGIVNMLYDAGFTPSVDQNLGGLLMWVPPCTLYVVVIIALLCRWYAELEPATERPVTAPYQPVSEAKS
ncbi:MAG: cytochrome c oxidase assembly protein [Pirellulales bacterium]